LIEITSFYRFNPLASEIYHNMKKELEALSARTGLRGLVLIGPEGINSTCAGSREAIAQLKMLVAQVGVNEFKDSQAEKQPFNVFRVKIKDEIVTMGQPGVAPSQERNFHLSPEEWHEALKDPNTVVLDTRNDYEVDIGKFKNAVDFRIQEFGEFPEKLKNSGIDTSKKVLMYCTGGIRCEKAILEAKAQGYENVFQLQGGILNYLEKFPNESFEGECFVFDYRVAVDQELKPTQKYGLCPHCGQPSSRPIECVQCGSEMAICSRCHGEKIDTCSKNCAHHRKLGSKSTKPHLQELEKRHRA
jgi:UPF0176 protein